MKNEELFNQLYPDYFAPGKLDYLKDDDVYEEMVLYSDEKDFEKVEIPTPKITFGYINTKNPEEAEKIKKAVLSVEEDWYQYFENTSESIYCAFYGTEIASFCLLSEMGTADIDGKKCRVGGPGCVGTVPEFRRKGIGLKMVQNATKLLFDEGYDISFIHYTGVAHWYAKLGYKTILKWNKNGIL